MKNAFALGLVVGAPLGACLVIAARFVAERLRDGDRMDHGPFIDGVSPLDPRVDWTIECESKSLSHELASEVPDFNEENQRWYGG